MQAASALRSLPVCSAKARKLRAVSLVTSSMRGASSARAIGPVPTMPRTRLMPAPAQDQAAHPLRMSEREKHGDARAHRIAHHIGAVDAEMVEQAARILGHGRRAIAARIVELLASSMPAIVEGDDAAAGLASACDPACASRQLAATLEAKPWMRRIGSPSPSSTIGDPHAVRIEALHSDLPLWPRGSLCSPAFPQREIDRTAVMAQTLVPHFVNDQGVDRIKIGVKEFQCMGATPPHDHPHVYLDMGHEAQIVCPYCSTLVPARPRAEGDGERSAVLRLRGHRPARRAGGLSAASDGQAGRSGAHRRRRHRRTCGGHCARPARDRERNPRALRISARRAVPASSSVPMPRGRCAPSASSMPSSLTASGPRRSSSMTVSRVAGSPRCRSARVEQRYGAPYLTLHRADLHAGLRAAAESLAPVVADAGLRAGGDRRRRRCGSWPESLDGGEGQRREPDRRRRPVVDRALSPHARCRACASPAPPPGARACRAAACPPRSTPRWSGSGSGLAPISCTTRSAAATSSMSLPWPKAVRTAKAGTSRTSAETLLASFARWSKDSKSLLERARGWRSWSLYRLAPSAPAGARVRSRFSATRRTRSCRSWRKARRSPSRTRSRSPPASRAGPSDPPPPSAVTRRCGGRAPRASSVCRGAIGWLYHLRGPLRFARNLAARAPQRGRAPCSASTGSTAPRTMRR